MSGVLRSTATKEGQMKSLRGFTYLEILATIIIMSIALIHIMRLMPEGIRATARVERLTKALFLAQRKMADIRSKIFGADDAYGFDKDYTQPATAFPSPDQTFKFTVSDSYVPGSGNNLKVLSVTVWFDENDNNAIDTYSEPYREDEASVKFYTEFTDRG